MNRIDRITAILIHLQSRRVVKAQEIAERFNISLRTVYRDIKTLEESGVPLMGEAGIGYSIMEGYRLPPVMFTKEEATAFLTAEKFVEKFTDHSIEAGYKSAMYKIRAVLKTGEKDMLENIENQIEIFGTHSSLTTHSLNNVLQILLKGISDRNAVHISYTAVNSKQATERNIEPIGIFYTNSYWHVIAYCCLRNDYRDFRVDRISEIRTTNTRFQKQHPSLKEYLEKEYHDADTQTVVIQVKKEVAPYLNSWKQQFGFVLESDAGEYIEMTFLSASLEGIARWYLMFADHAKIVQPEAMKEQVRSMAERTFSAINRSL